jgi:hypothetical protein
LAAIAVGLPVGGHPVDPFAVRPAQADGPNDGNPLAEGETEKMFTPTVSARSASLRDHCIRALNHAAGLGSHGLPLIGNGDWNDGLNLVGVGGKGESVWLAWFLHAALTRFAPLPLVVGAIQLADDDRIHRIVIRLPVALGRDNPSLTRCARRFYSEISLFPRRLS